MDDPTIGEILNEGTKEARQSLNEQVQAKTKAVGDAVFRYVFEHFQSISPLTSKFPIDRWLLISGSALLVISMVIGWAYTTIWISPVVVLPLSIPIILMGLLWKHSLKAKLGMAACGCALIAGVVSNIVTKHMNKAYQHELVEQETSQVKENAERHLTEEQIKAEKYAKMTAEQKAALAAEEAARKAEDERRNKEFLEARDKRTAKEEEERAAAAKKHHEEVLAAQKKEEEAKRAKIKAEEEAKAREDKRIVDLAAAETSYQEKALLAADLEHAVTKLEGELRVAKDECLTHELVLERENSPKPPPAADLKRARELQKQWKGEIDRIGSALDKTRVQSKNAASEKAAAAKLLDSLQKPQ